MKERLAKNFPRPLPGYHPFSPASLMHTPFHFQMMYKRVIMWRVIYTTVVRLFTDSRSSVRSVADSFHFAERGWLGMERRGNKALPQSSLMWHFVHRFLQVWSELRIVNCLSIILVLMCFNVTTKWILVPIVVRRYTRELLPPLLLTHGQIIARLARSSVRRRGTWALFV